MLFRALLMGGLLAGAFGMAGACAEDGHTFASETLNLRMTYPDMLEEQPSRAAIDHGKLSLMGFSDARAEAPGGVAACLRPLLFLRTPTPANAQTTQTRPAADGSETVTVTPAKAASLLLAELDPNCLSGAEQVSGHKELPVMAQQFLATPGMAAVAPPAAYNVGSQKVYMAAAQGHPRDAVAAGADPLQQGAGVPLTIFTMAIATTWNNHLLVWFMSSNQIAALNAISKSTVRFGREKEEPLYPLTMGDANPTGSPR